MKYLTLFLILLLGSCSSIDRSSAIKESRFVIGSSSKQDVINTIGLPNKVEKMGDIEYWLYSGKELRSDLFIPLPVAATQVGSNTYNVYYTDIGPQIKYDFEAVMVCAFGADMKLINAFDPRKKESVK